MSEAHASELWTAAQNAADSWVYLRYGPFAAEIELRKRLAELAARPEQPFWIARPATTNRAEGWLSLCDICPDDGAIELGSIWFSPRMQRTRASTEAVFLLMAYAFDTLGYQRLVWRCNNENLRSLRAAHRYGFKFEGVWRSAALIKGQLVDPDARGCRRAAVSVRATSISTRRSPGLMSSGAAEPDRPVCFRPNDPASRKGQELGTDGTTTRA